MSDNEKNGVRVDDASAKTGTDGDGKAKAAGGEDAASSDRENSDAAKPDAAKTDKDRDSLTVALRNNYQSTVEEGVPDIFQDLINKLK